MNIGERSAEIGKKVRQDRLRLGWTQEELAEKLDMSASYVSQIERGVRAVSLETLECLGQALGVKSADFLQKNSDKKSRHNPLTINQRMQSLLTGYTPDEQEVVYQTFKFMLRQNRKLAQSTHKS